MAEQNTPRSALEQELNKLGENLGNLVRALWESEERKAIERELSANLERLNKRVCEVVEKVRANEVVAGVQHSVKEAWETAHGPQILNEVQPAWPTRCASSTRRSRGAFSLPRRCNPTKACPSRPAMATRSA